MTCIVSTMKDITGVLIGFTRQNTQNIINYPTLYSMLVGDDVVLMKYVHHS